jgi:DNA-directed RNA polymerase subunit K/omega
MALQAVDLREIDNHASNVYEAIMVSGKRARQINDDLKMQYNQLLTTIQPTTIDDDSEDFNNPDQARISLEFEKKPKPHAQALSELMEDKLQVTYKHKVEKPNLSLFQ